MEKQEHIEMDLFDREYGLKDLLSVSLIKNLIKGFDNTIDSAILLPDGEPYVGVPDPKDFDLIRRNIDLLNDSPDADNNSILIGAGCALFPLVHELETAGFLFLKKNKDKCEKPEQLLKTGRLAAKCLNLLILSNYRNLMTSGLHCRVVEDSYAQLKKKAAELEKSEKRYRRLAENLEIEVEEKTREFKEAQIKILQQEKMASVGQLAAGMAHEINNPIGFIISNLNTLKDNITDIDSMFTYYGLFKGRVTCLCRDAAKKDEVLAMIKKLDDLDDHLDMSFLMEDIENLVDESLEGANRISVIVRDLKDFARPSVESEELVDLNQSIDNTLAMIAGKIGKGIVIEKAYGQIPCVTCFQREMNQVFLNVLLNALYAVEEKGKIVITTRIVGQMVEVCIADNGTGIKDENMSQIFNPFFTTKPVGTGTGLGLNLAYNIVKKHNGKIKVESTPGRGTAIYIKVPVKSNAPTDQNCFQM